MKQQQLGTQGKELASVAAGKTPAFADGQIAAISYTNNLILVTNNTSDFQNFLNLKLENWHQ